MVNFFKRNRIRPPQKVIPPKQQPPLLVPFEMADAVRVFLDYIARRPELTDETRWIIAQFLLGYRSQLGMWLIMNHGPEGVARADEITRHLMETFQRSVSEESNRATDDFFKNLEEQMKRPDDGPKEE